MWYLQIDTLCMILAFTVLYVSAGCLLKKLRLNYNISAILLVFDVFLIFYISEKLAVFYVLYTIFSYVLIHVLYTVRGKKRALFVLFCLIDVLPLIYVRAAAFVPQLPVWVTLIGFAYNMLKAIDGLFYVYYTGCKIQPMVYSHYLLFFPVITGGPIFRFRDFQASYSEPQWPDWETVQRCIKRIILGMFKKLVLVAWLQLGIQFLMHRSGHFYTSFAMVAVCYMSLYFDLSGYSDIAISVGTLVGFPTPENFKKPWEAATFTQFWRKWHVTLSDWIREHIFVVVNGKRLNKYLSALIGFCTMIVMAAWHGFNYSELICGIYLGLFMALENITGKTTINRRKTNKWIYAAHCLVVSFFFGLNAMFYFLNREQMYSVLGGFFRL